MRPLRTGRAEVVCEVDGAEHGEDDLLRLRRRRLRLRRGWRRGRARDSRPCGEAEKGYDEKCSGCRPGVNHGPAVLEGRDASRSFRGSLGFVPLVRVPAREDRRLCEGSPGCGCSQAHRPANEAAGPLGRGRAEPVRHAGGRGGVEAQGGAGRRARSCSSRWARGRARLAAQGARDGRRPGRARRRRRRRRLRSRRHLARARRGSRARGRGPRPLRPAVERLGRRSSRGRRRGASAATR